MAVSTGIPQIFQIGPRLFGGETLNSAIAQGLYSWTSGLTALGTNQATSLVLTTQLNQINTVASGTGVALPPAALGSVVAVMNMSAGPTSMAIYGNPVTNDTIDGIAAATGTTLSGAAGHKIAFFFCTVAGAWNSALLGAVSS